MMLSNLEMVKSTYEGDAKENGLKYQAYLAEHAEWTEAAGFPYAGTYVGYEEIFHNVFSRLGSEWDNYMAKPKEFYEDGNTIIVVGVYFGTYKLTGKFFEADFVHIWRVENGKIVRFKQYVDSHLVQASMLSK
ncbi:nuclear transport factor 2 family protein [Paenibacillus sp. FSL K6-1230]|uniref:nuclear transport factor 2 family protein n=2 Tax=Paenibacillus sp. FSL K6-1230 TaxID=2921603 RepID=UPI0030F6B4CB